MIWSLVLIAAAVLCQVNANKCPKDMPIRFKLRFSSRNGEMKMTMVPPRENPFDALAGSDTRFIYDDKFTFKLNVRRKLTTISRYFKLEEVCFNVRGASKVVGYFVVYPGPLGSFIVTKSIKDTTDWERVCFSVKPTLKLMSYAYFPASDDADIEVKYFKSNTCHAPRPEEY